jgi:hypothetical protein
MRRENGYSIAHGAGRPTASRDITLLVDAVCIINAISGTFPALLSSGRFERRRASSVRRDGWYEDGVWYEPADRRNVKRLA